MMQSAENPVYSDAQDLCARVCESMCTRALILNVGHVCQREGTCPATDETRIITPPCAEMLSPS